MLENIANIIFGFVDECVRKLSQGLCAIYFNYDAMTDTHFKASEILE